MDWYVDEPGDISELRKQFTDYLQRHAEPGSDLGSAALTFSELVTNAFEHGGGSVWVSVDWTGEYPDLTVRDLGPSFDLQSLETPDDRAARGRGLSIASSLARDIEIAARDGGGAKVSATLDVPRSSQASFDPPRRSASVLPVLSEAGPAGFGRESFLRALVVQMAQDLELNEGPDTAEALIAQVGTDVGGQMEDEFRRAMGAVGTLTPEQMAECFVRLKHAIDGDFYPIEINEERIVLANRRCPFGDAVKMAPALCRMTSSVFGGIAARNAEGASILLEERIAVGDHQCRVVINLGPEDPTAVGRHRYQSPAEDD